MSSNMKKLEYLKSILEASRQGGILDYYDELTEEGLTAKIDNEYGISIEPVEFECQDSLEPAYNILIGKVDEDSLIYSDIERIIAQANWFVSDSKVDVKVMDMPDGLNCVLTVTVRD